MGSGAGTKKLPHLKFRHGSSARLDEDFPIDQMWVTTSGNGCSEYVYVDETAELVKIYDTDFTAAPHPAASPLSPASSTVAATASSTVAATVTSEADTSGYSPLSTHAILPANSHGGTYGLAGELPHSVELVDTSGQIESPELHRDSVDASAGVPNLVSIQSLLRNTDVSSDLCPSPGTVDNLQSDDFLHNHATGHISPPGKLYDLGIQEACLMRYFVENLACWFDLCDPDRHFACVVPQRANHCPALLYAIYTASARHLCRLSKFRKENEVEYHGKRLSNLRSETAVEYHSRCIEQLVSISCNREALLDEDLFAASVILRFYEEVDAPLSGKDWETGLRGARVFIDAQSEAAMHDTGLRRAALRVAYRQEVYMSFIKQCRFRLPLTRCAAYRSLEPTDDFTWAHRMVIHCADVLMYCYGERQNALSEYDALVEYHHGLATLQPQSFMPILETEADETKGQFYPEVWFLSDCHVTGVQHADLAKILLTVYNPRIPRFGICQRLAIKKVEEELVTIVRHVCGVALSNPGAPPTMFTACMVIAMCGEQFSDAREQGAMLDILRRTETDYAWPTAEIQQTLKMRWELYDSDNQ